MNSQVRSAKHYIFLLICENPGITLPGLLKLIRKQIRLGWLCDQVCDAVYPSVYLLLNEGAICGSFDEVELLPTGIPAILKKTSALGKQLDSYLQRNHYEVPAAPVINERITLHRTKRAVKKTTASIMSEQELLGFAFGVKKVVAPKRAYRRRVVHQAKHQAMSSIETLFYKAVKTATSDYLKKNGVSVL